jgi:hypothetical protein
MRSLIWIQLFTLMRRVVDPHWFNADLDAAFFLIADPDPVLNPRFWWPKIGRNLQLTKNWIFFWKNCNLGIPRPSKRTHKLQEKPSALKKNIQHFKHDNSFLFSIFVGQFFPPGYRSSNWKKLMRIRIQNPAMRVRLLRIMWIHFHKLAAECS